MPARRPRPHVPVFTRTSHHLPLMVTQGAGHRYPDPEKTGPYDGARGTATVRRMLRIAIHGTAARLRVGYP